MSSTTLQKLSDANTGDAIAGAVEAVAERSFFAIVERCDEQVLRTLAKSVQRWLVATVRFDDGPLKGSMSCTLPEDLAYALFDGFSGRDPKEPLPGEQHLYDLVGEFANMVCGTWLSRCAGDRAFRLGPPLVARVGAPAAGAAGRSWVGIGSRPAAIDVWLHPASDAPVAAAGA
jgi:hypothetical protein